MLQKDLLGKPYSKTEHRRALLPLLRGRSKGSVEFKHQNISAVLVELGLPYIGGYKPRGNFRQLLAEQVERYLWQHPELIGRFAAAPKLNPTVVPNKAAINPVRVVEAPPDRIVVPKEAHKPWLSRRARRINFVERDAANRRLGELGEEFVVWLEKQRLLRVSGDDLADKVDRVSETVGDGLGFDVLSYFEQDDAEKFIEVKTTGLGKEWPFYVTALEVRCSADVGDRFHLFRVFEFGHSPRLYVLRGPLEEHCHLEPVVYRANR